MTEENGAGSVSFIMTFNLDDMEEAVLFARELAKEGKGDKHFDCSAACNKLVMLVLKGADENASDYHPDWKNKESP